MKVGILTHFQGFQSSYALHVGWHERARLLQRFGVDFDFLVWQKCPEGSYPNQRNCLPNLPSGRPFNSRVNEFYQCYKEVLKQYDVILTADLIYQRKGNFLAYNAAMRQASEELKGWWCHWIHSSWTERPSVMRRPDCLRYEMMDRSYLVYLNSYELPDLARMYDTQQNLCFPVYNPKDFRSFHEFDPLSWDIIDMLDLTNKMAIQIFPHCSTRMEGKGIDVVMHGMAALKRAGLSVGLVLANANSRSSGHLIKARKEFAKNLGLEDGKDFIFTSDILGPKPAPRSVVRDLFKVANVFWFGSYRETTGNVFQEALINGNLLILNRNLPCLLELATEDAIFIDCSYCTPGVADGRSGNLKSVGFSAGFEAYYDEVVRYRVLPALQSRAHLWQFSFDKIWHHQFKPLLDSAYAMSKQERLAA